MVLTNKFAHVLVTGGAGFVGSQLVQRLIPISDRITVIDDLSTGRRDALPSSNNLRLIEQSYVDEALLDEVLPDVEVVFHLACRNLVMSTRNTDDDFHVNLYGGYLLLKKAQERAVKLRRFIYTSTASVYGNAPVLPTPESHYDTALPYSASKLSTEHYCKVYYRLHQLPISILRLSNVYGPGQVSSNPYCGVVAKFFEAIDRGDPMPVYGDGKQTRDFTYIEDAVNAILTAAQHPNAPGKVFNVGTGIETSVNELAREIGALTGKSDYPVVYVAKRPVDVVNRRCLDATLLKQTLGWKANVPLKEGIRRTYAWLRREGDPA